MGIQYHGHGRHGNVVESMNVIGHGKESPWRWTRKVLSMWGQNGGFKMKVKELITMLQAFDEDQNVMVNVNGKDVDIVDVKDSADTNYPEEVIIQVAYNVG